MGSTLMRALVKVKEEHGFSLERVPVPEPGEREVLVRVKAAAICGSDIKLYKWTPWCRNVVKSLPFIPGHEGAGEVAATGSGVRKFQGGRPGGRRDPHPVREVLAVQPRPPAHLSRHGALRPHGERVLRRVSSPCRRPPSGSSPTGYPSNGGACSSRSESPSGRSTGARSRGTRSSSSGAVRSGNSRWGRPRSRGAPDRRPRRNQKRLASPNGWEPRHLINPNRNRCGSGSSR